MSNFEFALKASRRYQFPPVESGGPFNNFIFAGGKFHFDNFYFRVIDPGFIDEQRNNPNALLDEIDGGLLTEDISVYSLIPGIFNEPTVLYEEGNVIATTHIDGGPFPTTQDTF